MTQFTHSPEYLELIARRKAASARLGVTPAIRDAIRRSKCWNHSTGNTEFVDRQPDPYEQRFAVRGVLN
jgi:hypothetical protein